MTEPQTPSIKKAQLNGQRKHNGYRQHLITRLHTLYKTTNTSDLVEKLTVLEAAHMWECTVHVGVLSNLHEHQTPPTILVCMDFFYLFVFFSVGVF